MAFLRESEEVECKLATGRDGMGAIPDDFWKTYSVFANNKGGIILLGVRERNSQFEVVGLQKPDKLRKELFDVLNNKKKVSINLLDDSHVKEITLDEKTLLLITVPRAKRGQRTVYLNGNPLGNSYRRLNDGDRLLGDENVKRMLAEQTEESRDTVILTNFGLKDIHSESLRAYRQVFSNREPVHPWNALSDIDFLMKMGGWRKDRESGVEGLTMAGLLMFGDSSSIQDALPNYMLDYQEWPENGENNRWSDRITLDGKWSGNLYDFFHRVYARLIDNLKVPFRLEGTVRKDETPVHEALREALVNTLVHADFSDRASVLILKRPLSFRFRNPGLMRVPKEIALKGGEHDCRNRTLHKMFRLIGIGEQAGSGIPKILSSWNSQHWAPPIILEAMEPYDQTIVELRMVDLFPPDVQITLNQLFGESYRKLNELERTALSLAASKNTVSHAQLLDFSQRHNSDVTNALTTLAKLGFLKTSGGRGAVYHLPNVTFPTPEQVFGILAPSTSAILNPTSAIFDPTSVNLNPTSVNLNSTNQASVQRNNDGCLLSPLLESPIVDDLSSLTIPFLEHLYSEAGEARKKKKVDRQKMTEAILRICTNRYVTLRALAALLNREASGLRIQYLTQMVRKAELELAFPAKPNHERQAYTAARPKKEDSSQ
ncbi:MAG: putative DNA binding domain-containing protein [Candidatus Sumerlaeia bacterium]|nr:putative DNA binding domain-containing protein [Candidatus Sumerlaeia bacterium]